MAPGRNPNGPLAEIRMARCRTPNGPLHKSEWPVAEIRMAR
jgi:hypothetical protein